MGGLSHYIEDEGVPTTSISLIREHTEVVKPPRALWVPFELGRPFGVPNDAAFQRRVLVATLELLTADSGPVLADYGEEAPAGEGHATWACPIDLGAPATDATEAEKLQAAFTGEVAKMRSWYDLAVKERGRTTTGTSGLEPEAAAAFVAAFLDQGVPANPVDETPPALLLKLAAEDVKAYYFEAVTAQPGGAADSETLAEWFWGETTAGKMLSAVKQACMEKDDGMVNTIGAMMLVPMEQTMKGR